MSLKRVSSQTKLPTFKVEKKIASKARLLSWGNTWTIPETLLSLKPTILPEKWDGYLLCLSVVDYYQRISALMNHQTEMTVSLSSFLTESKIPYQSAPFSHTLTSFLYLSVSIVLSYTLRTDDNRYWQKTGIDLLETIIMISCNAFINQINYSITKYKVPIQHLKLF